MSEPVNYHKEYSPYDYPPDLNLARLHFENNQFGPDDPEIMEEERKDRTCPHSHQGPKKTYNLSTKIENLTSNGLETMLYFKNLRLILIFIGLYAASQLLPYIRLVRLYCEANKQKDGSCSKPYQMFYLVTTSMRYTTDSDSFY